MKLRNKKTGEIHELFGTDAICFSNGKLSVGGYDYNSLAELSEEWEDYDDREIEVSQYGVTVEIKCSSLQESAEIYRKLKAWKRLEDKGFKFEGYGKGTIYFKLDEEYAEYTYDGYDEGIEMYLDIDVERDLHRLFGGEK